jgi:heat shock protein HslJ
MSRQTLRVLICFIGSAACADQRGQPEGDSPASARVTKDPEATFRAQLGRTWELTSLDTQDIRATHTGAAARAPQRYPGPKTRPTIRFSTEPAALSSSGSGAFSAGGWSFCNGYGTAYHLGPGDQLRFEGFQSTLVGCYGPDSLETRFFRHLANTRRFEIDSSALSLIAADSSRLTFALLPDSVRSPPDRSP